MKFSMLIAVGIIAAVGLGGTIAQEMEASDDGMVPAAHPPRPPHPLLEALDADRDGMLSADEIAAAPIALQALDTNADGELAGDELHPPRPPRHDPLVRADANQDGVITLEEFTALAADRFAELDTNGDGSIDEEEAAAAPRPRHGPHGQDRRAGRPPRARAG